jgi:hypothetical protein
MKVIGEQDAAIFLARVNFVQPIFYSVFASHLATVGNKMCYPQEKKITNPSFRKFRRIHLSTITFSHLA